MKNEKLPIAYILSQASKADAQKICSQFVQDYPWPEKIEQLRTELKSTKKEKIIWNFAEFIGADDLKLAYLNGLKI